MLKTPVLPARRSPLRSLFPLVALSSVIATASICLHAQPVPDSALPTEAFTIPLEQTLPMTDKLKVGKLTNGLRYYIRANAEPKNRAELRLVIDAGSILEDDSQLGLAHVLEHMAFKGTLHFKKAEIQSYIESIGMRFGADLNASTDIDETIYMLQLPTDKPTYMQTGLQILGDWAQAITLDPEEMKSERSVVIEEWRRGLGAGARVRDKFFPVLFNGSQYAKRMPIGTLENLQNFKPEDLQRFYKDWYRPDLMAVVAVGDFDPAEIERLIHQNFDSMPAPKNPKPRTRFAVASHDDTRFAIINDPEVQTTRLTLVHKLPREFDWTVGGARKITLEGLFDSMLSTRFQEISRLPNPPFLGAGGGKDAPIRPMSAHVLVANVTEKGIDQGLEALMVEANRAARFGFTAEELDRQKTNMMRGIEKAYADSSTRTSASHTSEIVRYFLTGEPIEGTDYDLALLRRFLPGITLDEINQYAKTWMTGSNTVVEVVAPAKPDLVLPTEAELRGVIAKAASADIKPKTETANDEPLLAAPPKGSKVTGTKTLEGGLTEWTLANGIKVIVKPTDFKKDEIMFTGFSKGGTSLVGDPDYVPASNAVVSIAGGGLGKFTATDLQRKMTGKVASATPFISEFDEGIRGGASPADLETMFQLLYLRMTAPRLDATYFANLKTQIRSQLQNRASNPQTEFDDTFVRLMYQNHPRRQPATIELVDKLDQAKSLDIYKDRLGDATDFTFLFVGSIDLAVLQPLVETYIGGLPAAGRKETWKDVGVRSPTGVLEQTVRRGLDPKSSTRIAFTGPFNIKSLNERTLLAGTTEIVQTRLLNVLRQQLNGVYSVQVSRSMDWQPLETYTAMINFSSDPARAEEMSKALFAELDKLATEGPTDTEVADERQAILRQTETAAKQNGAWMGAMNFSYSSGINPGVSDFLQVPKSVEGITVDSVRKAVKQYFNKDNHIRVTLLPEQIAIAPAIK